MAIDILSFTSTWQGFQRACDSWPVVTGLFGLALILTRFQAMRPYVSGLVVPAALLFFRKVALYIPVSGTLSTEDEVFFWSTGAYLFFGLLLIVHAGVLAFICWEEDAFFTEELAAAPFPYLFFILPASVLLLPMDGWSHLLTPFLSHIAVAKLLFINPWLLPLVGGALIIHLAFACYRLSEGAREINKLLLVALMAGGIVQFGLQPWQLKDAREAIGVEESWEIFNSSFPSTNTKIQEADQFLTDWIARLDRIEQFKVNLVEPAKQNVYEAQTRQALVARLHRPWTNLTNHFDGTQVVLCGALALALLILARWPRSATEEATDLVALPDAETYRQALAPANNRVPPISQKALALNKWLYPLMVLSGLLIAVGIILKSAPVTGTGIAGLSIFWVMIEFMLLINRWLLRTADTLVQAIYIRDRKGRRVPTRLACKAMDRADEVEEVLNVQPAQFLLALAASNREGYAQTAALRLWPGMQAGFASTGSLATHPGCTTLTRLEFLANREHDGRAADLLPRNLWQSAIQTLAQSKFSDARVAATRCRDIARETLIALCGNDPEAEVRESAWRHLEGSLRAHDVAQLIRSKQADVRGAVLESATVLEGRMLPRRTALTLCYGDSSDEVRDRAWRYVAPEVTQSQTKKLSASPFRDVRLHAVRSGKLPRRRLKRLLLHDPDREVRHHAFEKIKTEISQHEVRLMVGSQYSDVRLRAIQSGYPEDAKLEQLCLRDLDKDVRQAAWKALYNRLAFDKIKGLLEKDPLTLLPCAIESGDLPRESLLKHCASDWQSEVRQKAWEKLRSELIATEAVSLSQSIYGEVRLGAIQTGLLPRERLLVMCYRDENTQVRRQAWRKLCDGLTAVEAEAASHSIDHCVRLAATESNLLSPARLRELTQDEFVAVRAAARRAVEKGLLNSTTA